MSTQWKIWKQCVSIDRTEHTFRYSNIGRITGFPAKVEHLCSTGHLLHSMFGWRRGFIPKAVFAARVANVRKVREADLGLPFQH